MRTVTHTRQGDATQVLTLSEAPSPAAPGPGQIRVRVLARPVHPGDLAGVEGAPGLAPQRYAEPRTPGVEGMGVVESVGAEVPALRPGQRVAFFPVQGTWSDVVTVAAELAVPVPDAVSDETAALMLVNPLTLLTLFRPVQEALRDRDGPVLQTAAGSSIGRLVSAAAVRHGVELINLVRSEAGAQKLRALHPTLPVIATSGDGWRDQVRHLVGARGAQVVLDAVGGSMTTDLTALLADGGTLISYGQLGSGTTPLESLAMIPRGLTVRGVSVLRWPTRTPEERADDVAFAVDIAQTRPELLEVAGSYDLADVASAIEHVRRPSRSGTVLLTSPPPASIEETS